MSASEIILVSRVDPAPISRGISHAYHAIALLWNQRRIGTFLRRRLTTTLAAYLILDAIVSAPPPPPALHTVQKQTLFAIHTLTREDLTYRLIATLSYWFSGFLLLLTVSNTLAILLVLTNLSTPADRPPLFGALPAAHSLRRFWGTLWHQCLRRGLTGHADLVADRLLRAPRGTRASRYARLFAAFLLSGLVHRACERGMGVPPADGGALLFFPLQALGILAEDAVQAVVGRRVRARVGRAVGYVWVVVFLAWSSPVWFYPQQRVGTDPELLMPVRLFGPLVRVVKGFL
ncbi:tri7-like toxin biosynthesis protein [Neofusicoccum parvum]|uniref:Tri7-like toxin biosynthesis protein n=1 Tax=Neofusicoccum parvum TaxID=310453 RepID=A0ACB5SNN1_9PEZI|nr:tri7-like toxin biosynthesis protein [Neofusicoccum parvum]GME48551.1 tri7-like toxin biosynthesis protein [Neofusicoccum parvum]